jgi:hypothetical protein
MQAVRASPVLIKSEPGSGLCFDAFSSREPVRASLKNAICMRAALLLVRLLGKEGLPRLS